MAWRVPRRRRPRRTRPDLPMSPRVGPRTRLNWSARQGPAPWELPEARRSSPPLTQALPRVAARAEHARVSRQGLATQRQRHPIVGRELVVVSVASSAGPYRCSGRRTDVVCIRPEAAGPARRGGETPTVQPCQAPLVGTVSTGLGWSDRLSSGGAARPSSRRASLASGSGPPEAAANSSTPRSGMAPK